MRSKTSFFDKTVYKKNLTRFAPVWVLYTLVLLLGIILMYNDGGDQKSFWFAYYLAKINEVLGYVNLVYAWLVAQMLFGDLLYNSRMCNGLHAMPVAREGWFGTNLLSGVTFSILPTAVAALATLPLLAGSIYTDAWLLAVYAFIGSNLMFLCFFGLAVFAAMAVGNRFTMTAGYCLLNFGAAIFYWLVDTAYTPLLYGVITPTSLASKLTPLSHMTNVQFIDPERLYNIYGSSLEGATASFQLTGEGWRLLVLAAVGMVFAAAALMLYRRRNLECAGDAVAFPVLVPVFQVLSAVVVATGFHLFLYTFMGVRDLSYLFLAVGLVIGWFAGKMLLERTTRVFRPKNWVGLAALTAVLAVTLTLTYFDIFGIQTRIPKAEEIESVFFETGYTRGFTLTEDEDIEDMLQLHALALEAPMEDTGTYAYVCTDDGQRVRYTDTSAAIYGTPQEIDHFVYSAEVGLTYKLKNGNTVRRRYTIWTDGDAADIARRTLSSWDGVNATYGFYEGVYGEKVDRLTLALSTFEGISIYPAVQGLSEYQDIESANSLLEAIQADCAAGTMAQDRYFHNGHFRIEDDEYESGYTTSDCLEITIRGEEYNWYIQVYPDSENTLRWLQERDLLGAEIRPENVRGY